jgi:hypothetical protein
MKIKTILGVFIVIALFEGCAPGIVPLATDDCFIALNNINYKGEKTTLPFEQRQEKANYYKMKGIAEMNSNDTNKLKLARKYFLASLTFMDTKSEVWSYLGDVSVNESQINETIDESNKLKNAIYYYNIAIEIDNMNDQYYYKRGTCFYALNDTACISDYRKACSLGNAHACDILKEVMKK